MILFCILTSKELMYQLKALYENCIYTSKVIILIIQNTNRIPNFWIPYKCTNMQLFYSKSIKYSFIKKMYLG